MTFLTATASVFYAIVRRQTSGGVRRNPIFACVAALAILMNLAVPVSPAISSDAAANDYVEICTSDGVDLVSLAELGLNSSPPSQNEHCPSCADCAECRLSAASGLAYMSPSGPHEIEISEALSDFTSDQDLWVSSLDQWPESRAPPFQTS